MAIDRSGAGGVSNIASVRSGKSLFSPVVRPTRQANILIYGTEGTGKTSFCTRYAPCPIKVISLDGRCDDAAYEAVRLGRDVSIARLFMPANTMTRDQTKREAESLLDTINEQFEIAISSARTVLVDTVTELAEICKLALDGTIEKTREHSHGEDGDFKNRQIWKMANLARQSKCHLIFTARMTEIWKDQKPTGRFKPQCPKATLAAVDWAGQIRIRDMKMGMKSPQFEIEITKAGTDIEQLFEVYDESLWEPFGGPFVYACTMNYKDSDPSDWE